MAQETILDYDAQPSPAHQHICTNPRHTPARTWTCTTPNCLNIYAWQRCEVCDPPPGPPPPPCQSGCPCPSRVTPLRQSQWV
jgi:hypothetical protein